MMQAVENRLGTNVAPSKPIEWFSDNGSCYTKAEKRSFKRLLRVKPIITRVNSPKINGMAESSEKTLKNDCVKLAHRPDSKTVTAQLQAWFNDYNSYNPHCALGYLPPIMFRQKQPET